MESPDTRVPGSDAAELLGWLFGGLPGLLYCWWRHTNRSHHCAHCGSRQLVREARAAAARRASVDADGELVRSWMPHASGLWPQLLRAPRARLRAGSSALLVAGVSLQAWAASAAPAIGLETLATAMAAATLVVAAKLAWPVLRASLRTVKPARAWDQHGRPLRIEVI